MRTTAIVLLLGASLLLSARAQIPQCVAISGVNLIGQFADTVMQQCGQAASKPKPFGHVNICVWLVSSGRVEYSIHAEDIDIIDECGTVDALTTPEIISMIATHTVARGAALGYTPCPETGSVQTAVWFAACVDRSGSGSGTTFAQNGSLLNRSTFSYTCASGEAAVTATGCSGGSCESGEATCGEGRIQ